MSSLCYGEGITYCFYFCALLQQEDLAISSARSAVQVDSFGYSQTDCIGLHNVSWARAFIVNTV